MVKCRLTISFFRPIVIYNLTLNFISPLETQLSSFRFVVIGTINIHLYNSNTHVNSSQYWSGSGCSFSLNVYRKRELYSSAALTSVFCRKHIVIDGYDSEIILKPGYLILPKKKKKIQYAVQESNIKIWVALCWFSLFRNLYTFRRYDMKIMTFITFIFPLSWQNVHTLSQRKGKLHNTIEILVRLSVLPASTWLLDGWEWNWQKYQIILTFAPIRFRLTLAFFGRYTGKNQRKFYTWCKATQKSGNHYYT